MIEATQNIQTVDQRVEKRFQNKDHIESTRSYKFDSPKHIKQSESLHSTNSDRQFIKDKHNMFKTKSTFNKVQIGAYDSFDGIGSYGNYEFLKTADNN